MRSPLGQWYHLEDFRPCYGTGGLVCFENLPETIQPSLIAPQYNKPGDAGDNGPVEGLDLRRLGYEQGSVQANEQEITYHQPGWGGFYYDVNVRWKQSGKKLYGV